MRVDDPSEIERILDGSAIGGRRVEAPRLALGSREQALLRASGRSVEEPRPGESVLVIAGLAASELEEAFDAARAAVGVTGRYPVATVAWSNEPLVEQLHGRYPPLVEFEVLEDEVLDARVEEAFARYDTFRLPDHVRALEHHLGETRRMCGDAPSWRDVEDALGRRDPGEKELDRWLFSWETARVGIEVTARRDDYLNWFVPSDGLGECGIVLTTTSSPWRAAALFGFFGVDSPEDQLLFVSLLKRWSDRWGAEIFANYGTMLEFLVHRAPTEPTDLIQLAVEHHVLARDTMLLPGISLREHARALRGRPDWFLHSKP